MTRPYYDNDDDRDYFESLDSDEPDYEAIAEARYGDPEAALERAERSYERYMTGH